MKIPFLISLISGLLTFHTLSAKVTMIREGNGVSLQQVINDAAAGDSIIIEGGRYKEGKIINEDMPGDGFGTSFIGLRSTLYKRLQPDERFVGLGEVLSVPGSAAQRAGPILDPMRAQRRF